jgi:anti-anti-sigma factor
VPVAHLQGEIDRSNAGAIEPELLALAPGPVVVDLSRLAFLSSAGLAVLFGLAKQCVRMIVVAPSGAPFRRTLEVAELSSVAQIVDSVHLALEDFA